VAKTCWSLYPISIVAESGGAWSTQALLPPTYCSLSWVTIWLICFSLAVLTLASCKETGTSPDNLLEERERQAVQIAADFAQDGDLERARTRLRSLDMPKPEQWLAMLAERYIAENRDLTATNHLVSLSLALGVKTASLIRYAKAHLILTPQLTGTPTEAPMIEISRASSEEPLSLVTLERSHSLTPVPISVSPPSSTPTPTVAFSPTPSAIVRVEVLNVRAGPGTEYPVVGHLAAGELVEIVGRNADGTWWQIRHPRGQNGWVSGALVEAQGALNDVPVIAKVPTPPPTSTPRPSTPTPVSQPQMDFRVVRTRLLSIQENGGCMGMHNIFVTVLDAAGAPLDGVQVGRVWVPEDVKTTGADNKGPGKVIFDLFKHGDQVRILNYNSETTRPLEVEDEKIPIPELIEAGYCPSEDECHRLINENRLCRFHYSWEVIFQRTW
jgi:uncharacterized protein YgiM (DUF1202 family)